MVNISHVAYCCLPHWGPSKWPNEGENTGVDSTDQSPLVHWPEERTRQYLKMMKTTFSGQWCSEQRLQRDDIWRPLLNLRNVSNREQPVPDYDSRMRKRNCMRLHRKWFSTHWERKWWLSLFVMSVIRSQQTPSLKASKAQPWEVFLPDMMPTWKQTSHNKTDTVSYKLQLTVLTLGCATNRSCLTMSWESNKHVTKSC